jgi:hypothetical protein
MAYTVRARCRVRLQRSTVSNRVLQRFCGRRWKVKSNGAKRRCQGGRWDARRIDVRAKMAKNYYSILYKRCKGMLADNNTSNGVDAGSDDGVGSSGSERLDGAVSRTVPGFADLLGTAVVLSNTPPPGLEVRTTNAKGSWVPLWFPWLTKRAAIHFSTENSH